MEYSLAAKECNILNFCGMMENDRFQKIIDTGAKTVRIVKPYADNSKVKDQVMFAESIGAFAVGMDIDHIFGEKGHDVLTKPPFALGADACAVGRSMLPALEEGGTDGVAGFVNSVNDGLRYIMSFTGSAGVGDIDPSVLHFTGQCM